MKQPREDYREFLELVIIFLNGTVPKFSFRAPGAFHHARWMAKAIYSLKIFLFRDQFTLTTDEKNGIRQICIFLSKLYLKAWVQAPIAAEAPNQDLNFFKNLYAYSANNDNVSRVAVQKFSNHLWYLTPETVALAFFDPKIPHDVKQQMIVAVKAENTVSDNDIKRLVVDSANVNKYVGSNIAAFM